MLEFVPTLGLKWLIGANSANLNDGTTSAVQRKPAYLEYREEHAI
jgi:hypothetical protein